MIHRNHLDYLQLHVKSCYEEGTRRCVEMNVVLALSGCTSPCRQRTFSTARDAPDALVFQTKDIFVLHIYRSEMATNYRRFS